MRPQCIITGCAIRIEGLDGEGWGDLHIFSDNRRPGVYVFVATVNRDWAFLGHISKEIGVKRITVQRSTHYIERRGIVIVPTGGATLNEAAMNHVLEWSPEVEGDVTPIELPPHPPLPFPDATLHDADGRAIGHAFHYKKVLAYAERYARIALAQVVGGNAPQTETEAR